MAGALCAAYRLPHERLNPAEAKAAVDAADAADADDAEFHEAVELEPESQLAFEPVPGPDAWPDTSSVTKSGSDEAAYDQQMSLLNAEEQLLQQQLQQVRCVRN
eukprot:COSAG05_NODE_10102_length_583_cov_0.745868_2_plen_104_part_00